MEYSSLLKRAKKVRSLFSKFEQKNYGKQWGIKEIMEGFVVDTGELMRLIMAKEGYRIEADIDEKLSHELTDCLWCLLVLSDKLNIDLDEEFMKKMDDLEKFINNKNK